MYVWHSNFSVGSASPITVLLLCSLSISLFTLLSLVVSKIFVVLCKLCRQLLFWWCNIYFCVLFKLNLTLMFAEPSLTLIIPPQVVFHITLFSILPIYFALLTAFGSMYWFFVWLTYLYAVWHRILRGSFSAAYIVAFCSFQFLNVFWLSKETISAF